jgi:hypothetical protein
MSRAAPPAKKDPPGVKPADQNKQAIRGEFNFLVREKQLSARRREFLPRELVRLMWHLAESAHPGRRIVFREQRGQKEAT